MRPTPLTDAVLVVVPAYGAAHLTDAVVGDLLAEDPCLLPHRRVVVVDNRGDYVPAGSDDRLSVHRPGENLRWIGTVNWALDEAAAHDEVTCIVVNNDTRLSPDFSYWVARTMVDCTDVAVASPCYDDFWLHQRARVVPESADRYEPVLAYREVGFCDGTGIAFDVAAAERIGRLDRVLFPRHGYGADIDYALRAKTLGFRCVVTETAYLSHLRRGTMNLLPEETSERNRHEILTGLDARWGEGWRGAVGLGPGAFPAHNTGSAASWYA